MKTEHRRTEHRRTEHRGADTTSQAQPTVPATVPTQEARRPAGPVSATGERPTGAKRYRAGMTAIAPAVFLAAIAYHPPLGDLRDKQAVADALVSDTTRWALAHLLVGVAIGLVALAFLAVRDELAERGESRVSAVGAPFIVLSSVLFAFLPAMEIAMLAVRETGGDVEAVMVEMDRWFIPTLVVSGALFAIGAILYAVAVVRRRVLGTGLTWVVAVALGITALARFVPFGAALYVGAAALLVALLPLALVMVQGEEEAASHG